MNRPDEAGRDELRDARAENNGLLTFVAIFSVFVNLLMLTGPIFMLQVYDRVLGSRSEATLVALAALVAFLYLMMGILDYVRGRVLTRVGARFQSKLDRRVFAAAIEDAARSDRKQVSAGTRDLETVQKFLASPVLSAMFDVPFTPVFLAGIFLFHPWLGYLAVAGGAVIVLITVMNQMNTRHAHMLKGTNCPGQLPFKGTQLIDVLHKICCSKGGRIIKNLIPHRSAIWQPLFGQ